MDEPKFGKKKYNSGRRVDGHWVFGNVERFSGKLFLFAVHDKTCDFKFYLAELLFQASCEKKIDAFNKFSELGSWIGPILAICKSWIVKWTLLI
ncbi:hypothetical protein NPIL_552671 [Nephila pilipes]|uniref:Uncharacterized protein n=1 Tax=Nephila pilipes TaxID=299642 RepID=A0A8X6UQX7_NEPPI|nr:hypothetical protein NPIL_552671 [Nephila pilipes]